MSPETRSKMLEECEATLLALLGSKGLAEGWWTSPNRAFGMQTPEDAFAESPQVVRNYLRKF